MSDQKNIREKMSLPYYGSAGFLSHTGASSRFRRRNPVVFLVIKLKNYILGLLAYTCPVNNLRVLFHRWRGVNIGRNVFIGLRCTLDHAYPEYIYLEDNVSLSGDIYIVAHNKPQEHFRRKVPSFVAPVVVEKNVFVGVRAVVLPGVRIGEGSFVSGGAVVVSDVPPNSIIRGNPGEVIHNLNPVDR